MFHGKIYIFFLLQHFCLFVNFSGQIEEESKKKQEEKLALKNP